MVGYRRWCKQEILSCFLKPFKPTSGDLVIFWKSLKNPLQNLNLSVCQISWLLDVSLLGLETTPFWGFFDTLMLKRVVKSKFSIKVKFSSRQLEFTSTYQISWLLDFPLAIYTDDKQYNSLDHFLTFYAQVSWLLDELLDNLW